MASFGSKNFHSTLLYNNHGKPKSQVTGETLYFDEYNVHYLHYIYNSTFTILLCILNPHTRCVFTGTGQALFDHIASCLSDFVHDRKIENEILPLGFTFSFPCQQEGLAKAKLVKWTKGLETDETLGCFVA